jgi:hypothetical protein
MRDTLLLVDGFSFSFVGAIDVVLDLVGEHVRIAAIHRLKFRFLPTKELAEQAAARARFDVGRRRGKLGNRVGLNVKRSRQRAQVADELLLVPRRQERREQNHVGHTGSNRGDRGVP